MEQFVEEISKRCGPSAGHAFDLVDQHKEMCFEDDEHKLKEDIYQLLKQENRMVEDFEYFI